MTESGQIVVDGHPTHYLIRHLPVSSFPELPAEIQDLLNSARLHDSTNLRGSSSGERGSCQP